MPVITKIKPQKRKNRFNIYLDDEYAFPVSDEVLIKYGLTIDKSLTQDNIEEIIYEDNYSKIFSKSLNLLSYRIRTEKEVSDRLNIYLFKLKLENAQTSRIKENILSKLNALNLINDAEFAKTYVSQKIESNKPLSNRQIKYKLYRKGISSELIDKYLPKEKFESEFERAQKVVNKKFKTLQGFTKNEIKKKIYSYLSQKGFPSDVIYAVIDTKIKVQ